MYAVIETGGKQYKVTEQEIIFVEKLGAAEGDEVVFDSVVALSDNNGFRVGAPTVDGAKVTAKNTRINRLTRLAIVNAVMSPAPRNSPSTAILKPIRYPSFINRS